MTVERDEVVERFTQAGQGHVFRFLDSLPHDEADALIAQAAAIDVGLTARLCRDDSDVGGERLIEPAGPEVVRMRATDDHRRLRKSARDRGLAAIREGSVAVMIAAGGQGTRLGMKDPKGMFEVGPNSGKSLFAWNAAKIRYWQTWSSRTIPLVVMVSEATRTRTVEFFEENDHFGLDPEHVHFPCQESVPPVDDDGRMMLAASGRIATSPNGHGGVYRTLCADGLLDRLEAAGVSIISYVQIDNPLIHAIDPVFIGFHLRAESQISSKSVMKRSPAEKVGVFARVNGQSSVVEYSELTDEQAHAVDEAGGLLYGQGSIAAHCLDTTFVRQMADRGLPYHRARKKVPYIDDAGTLCAPDEPNATKFEMFLFDAIPLADRALVLETDRAAEFSPIKNGQGEDSPETSARDVQAMFRAWYERAGLDVPPEPIEIDPAVAPDEREFRASRGLPHEA